MFRSHGGHSQPGTSPNSRTEIGQGLLTPSLTQLLHDQVRLQPQQQGLAGVGRASRGPSLQDLRLIQGPFTGRRITTLQTAAGGDLNRSQDNGLGRCWAGRQQQQGGDCDGSCDHETWRRFAEMMTQLRALAQPCTPTGLRSPCCCSPQSRGLSWWLRRRSSCCETRRKPPWDEGVLRRLAQDG